MVILYNVSQMTDILIKIQNEGKIEITQDLLAHLNPYRMNLNRFGSYSLDVKRKVSPLDHKKIILLVINTLSSLIPNFIRMPADPHLKNP